MDCGPACVGMIARFYGLPCSLMELAGLCGVAAEGVSLQVLSEVAEAIGLRAMAMAISLEAIEKEKLLPFIAHWSQRHFMVVYKVRGSRVWVADPARGLLVLERKEFLEQWIGEKGLGIALLLEPAEGFLEEVKKNKP